MLRYTMQVQNIVANRLKKHDAQKSVLIFDFPIYPFSQGSRPTKNGPTSFMDGPLPGSAVIIHAQVGPPPISHMAVMG